MRKFLPLLLLWLGISFSAVAQTTAVQLSPADSLFPIRALAIAAPAPAKLDSFLVFMQKELVSRKVNVLILRVDFNYQFSSHPELRSSNALSLADAQRLAQAAKAGGIRIVPQINLLGHQSWASETGKLLQVYPQFDETSWVKMPAKYEWPNADSLYCKSYCPLHPDLHKIVFALVDEICDAFGADAFHAGMDEVFYIGDSRCPRCRGKNKAELFAGEVNKIRDHLALKGRRLWIWGDRLIDGHSTGIGGWEASFNNTFPAIDLVKKDVMICDWHYERADKTPVYFAMKGFQVITCAWNRPAVTVQQVRDMANFRATATPEMRDRYQGMMLTVWSPADRFLREAFQQPPDDKVSAEGRSTQWYSFRQMFDEISRFK